jgi:hypothetical protein
MAQTTRQQNLLVAEDWQKIYQSFRNADFKAYDYETLRKTMIDYLRIYYPEDFNDFIESSEYIALVDLIAFLGQNLAFRADLNARENFIDTAERRDSVLRLAKLISYNPQRNVPATGFLKIDNISTTESLIDSDGADLTNAVIFWNDVTNSNWLEQFILIINASLVSSQRVGKPGNSQLIADVKTDEYRINLGFGADNVYKFSSTIQGNPLTFEMVSATSQNKNTIYEVPPASNSTFSLLNRNDNLGNASNNTGFFVLFKQGDLTSIDLNLSESIPNRVVSINQSNINNGDVWLYQLDQSGLASDLWTPVPSVGITNIAYNKASSTNRKLYEISSRADDQIDLVFGDGVFAEIPYGRFRLFYRVSNNLSYKISPDEMSDIQVRISYLSKKNRVETLTITASLKYTVNNARSRESLSDIKIKAPQQYYTQNRMVNGEDYNILPFTRFSNVIKAKAVNRTSSGISRFLDVLDTTGKYSSTNIFCQDGILYRENVNESTSFGFTTVSDIQQTIESVVLPLLNSEKFLHFYYEYFDRFSLSNTFWTQVTQETNRSTGYFVNSSGGTLSIGASVSGVRRNMRVGALIKFWAGSGKYFDVNRQIQLGSPSKEGESEFLFASIQGIDADGVYDEFELDSFGFGPVALNEIVPGEAEAMQIIPAYTNSIFASVREEMIDKIFQYRDFGIGYDPTELTWYIITNENIDIENPFSEAFAKDSSNTNLDSSWMIRFETDGTTYSVYNRGLEYFFESEIETRFYYDRRQVIFDSKTGLVIQDNVKLLRANSQPDSGAALPVPVTLKIYDNVVENDGYENNRRIRVTYNDADNDGVPGDPDFFKAVVDPLVNPENKRVFYQNIDSTISPLASGKVVIEHDTLAEIEANKTRYLNQTIFYAETDDKFYVLTVAGSTRTLTENTSYLYKVGRQNLIFQYRHNSPNNRRIDPSPNNIIDLYLLTKTFDEDYRRYLADTTNSLVRPEEPGSEDLRLEFQDLENIKMISDTVIYNSAKFRPLFGANAEPELRAVFKIVKNASTTVSDTEIKSKTVAALNNYFAIENWDFGETFYFTELSAYLHRVLATFISSVVLVPLNSSQKFGSLFQINAEPDEIFINAATADDVEIISSLTATQLNTTI